MIWVSRRPSTAVIVRAFQNGIVTSASLLVTGSAFEEAVALARQNPNLDVGLHLALVEERSVLGPDLLPTLVDQSGRFPRTSGEFIRRAILGGISWTKSNARLQRKSLFLRRLDYRFPILIATSISTCSRLFFKSLSGLPAGWVMFGFGILSAPGENRGIRQWDAGYSSLV